jgi:hypothetical protein
MQWYASETHASAFPMSLTSNANDFSSLVCCCASKKQGKTNLEVHGKKYKCCVLMHLDYPFA